MLLVVAAICFLVQVYSLGYMAGDPGLFPLLRFHVPVRLGHDFHDRGALPASALCVLGTGGAQLVPADRVLVRKIQRQHGRQKGVRDDPPGDVAFFLGLLLVLANMGNLNILEMNGDRP
jgi:NADH-quinone oxidoreductase subunit L